VPRRGSPVSGKPFHPLFNSKRPIQLTQIVPPESRRSKKSAPMGAYAALAVHAPNDSDTNPELPIFRPCRKLERTCRTGNHAIEREDSAVTIGFRGGSRRDTRLAAVRDFVIADPEMQKRLRAHGGVALIAVDHVVLRSIAIPIWAPLRSNSIVVGAAMRKALERFVSSLVF